MAKTPQTLTPTPPTPPANTLLTYQVLTNPDPLQASPVTGDPSKATLTIVVSNSTRTVIDCSSISFKFLPGPSANEFFSDATGIGTTKPSGWNFEQEGATFTAKPKTTADGEIGSAGLTFVISNISVNTEPGTTFMTITEEASQPNVPTPMPKASRTTRTPLAKFPPQFHVGDLTASPPPPIANDGSVTLSWSGSSGATYELQYEAYGQTVTIEHPKGEPGQPLPSTAVTRLTTYRVIQRSICM